MHKPTENSAMLAAYTVLDLSDNKAFTCGRFLASLGAQVIKLEPPGGDPLRKQPGSSLNDQTSVQWLVNNLGKKSITLNLQHEGGRELFKRLVPKVHFIIESFTPGYLDDLGLGYEQLKVLNKEIILVSVSPFGQTGPYAQYQGGELVASAMGGTLDTCGYPNDTPVLEALDACVFHANAAASMGAMMAHRERGLSGLGQHVDCSIQEVAASRNTNNLLSYQFDQRKLERSGNKIRFGPATVRVVWELTDGFCFHVLMTGKFGASANAALSQWMSDDGLENPMQDVDWDKYDRSTLDPALRMEWETAMDRFFKSKTKKSIKQEGEERGIRATVCHAPDDIIHDEQLVARDFLKKVELLEGKAVAYPDYFMRLRQGQYQIPPLVSASGEHNEELYKELLELTPEQIQDYLQKGVL